MVFNKTQQLIIAIAITAQIVSADSIEVKTDSLLLYAPITGITIDTNRAMDQWARYLSKSALSAQTKEYNNRQLCQINNVLDSLKGQKNTTDCGCDTVASFLSLKESFRIINQWKKSFQRNRRIIYRK